MGNENLWNSLLSKIQGSIGRQNYEIWFLQTRVISITSDEIHLMVPSQTHRNWLMDNYHSMIQKELEQLTGTRFRLVFHYKSAPSTSGTAAETQSPISEVGRTAATTLPHEEVAAGQFSLNPEKTFSNFVVGSSNQFAHAGAMAVAENPARTYNPLFIFGTVGLGKTHLLNAIGNRIVRDRPGARVVFLSGEQFTNEMINSIRDERMNEFRNKYRRTCDALLMDDIQFLAGKLRTQEEFFYTFNELHSSGRQIVVTADKFPRDILGLEERLRNRFEWGLIADIQPPDMETKVAILKKKAAFQEVHIPDDVAIYIASNIKSNIRELEGILTRLTAAASFYNQAIDMTFTRQILAQLLEDGKPPITVESIQEATSRYFDLKLADLKGNRRHQHLVYPRQIAMYLARKHTSSSFPEIGQKFSGKDHTTVIHAVNKIEKLLANDQNVQIVVEELKRTMGL